MTTAASKEALLAELDGVVGRVLEHAVNRASNLQTAGGDAWGLAETLAHFLYYHDAAAFGIASTSSGGAPWPNPWAVDRINEVSVALHEGESPAELIAQVRLAHGRLMRAAHAAPDLDAVVNVRVTGETVTLRARIEGTISHWREHLNGLEKGA